jgi:hypothetical protein
MAREYYDEEASYLRSLEEERIELVGPTLEYYSLNRGENVDPLYGEPTNDPLYGGSGSQGDPSISTESWNFYPDTGQGESVVTFPCAIEYQEGDNRQPMVRTEGFLHEYDAIMAVSRNHWECAWEDTPIAGREPKEGDVLYLFGEWWDVVKVGRHGYILNSPDFVGYRFELKKRTQYTPDRKV